MRTSITLSALALLALTSCASVHHDTGSDEDRAAIRAAVEDYVLAIYEATPERIERSVAPDLAKVGYYRDEETGNYSRMPMTRDQLVALAGWYKDSGNLSAGPRKEIEVVDVLENVATAKLVADWGVDFMQLTKTDGAWQIVHIVWNSHPE
jgi:hypothetical protein